MRAPAPRPRGHRTALAIALGALLVAGAVVAGVIARPPGEEAAPKPATAERQTTPETVEAGGEAAREPGGMELSYLEDVQRSWAKAPFSLDAGARAKDVDMSLELRVAGADELSDATNEAMRSTRALGGVVVSSDVNTRGDEGRTRLELRVPVARLDDAVLRLSALGKITSQRVATVDLQGRIDRRSREVTRLERAIERDELVLASGTLSAEERLEVELRLAGARARLQDLRRAVARLRREAAMVELSLTLHTRAAPSGKAEEGRVGGAAADAVDFLGRAGAVAVFALIALSPLLILATVLWAVLRSRRHRLEDRLLGEPRPHAPPS